MKLVKIKRLWHGKVSIRDYIVNECIQKKEDIMVELAEKNEKMLILHADLSKGKTNKDYFQSQHEKMLYRLVDFKWKRNQPKQTTLL